MEVGKDFSVVPCRTSHRTVERDFYSGVSISISQMRAWVLRGEGGEITHQATREKH